MRPWFALMVALARRFVNDDGELALADEDEDVALAHPAFDPEPHCGAGAGRELREKSATRTPNYFHDFGAGSCSDRLVAFRSDRANLFSRSSRRRCAATIRALRSAWPLRRAIRATPPAPHRGCARWREQQR